MQSSSSSGRVMYNLETILAVDGLRALLLSYLWFKDILSVSAINKLNRTIIIDDDTFVPFEIFNLLLEKSGRHIDRLDTIKWNFRTMLAFARRLTKWPSTLALSDSMIGEYEYEIEVINRDRDRHLLPSSTIANRNACFAYQGRDQGENRTVVSDDHFPVMIQSEYASITGLRPVSTVPFTKIVYDGTLQKSIPVLSYIAYFEITVHQTKKPYRHTPQRRRRQQQHHFDEMEEVEGNPPLRPCVCIGIARPGFELYDLMPGWDLHSFAFHGDDGLYFSGQPNRGVSLHDDASKLAFGDGDTVGFGIIYPYSGINLDANGAIPPVLREEQEKKAWDNWRRTAEWASEMFRQTTTTNDDQSDDASSFSNTSSSSKSSMEESKDPLAEDSSRMDTEEPLQATNNNLTPSTKSTMAEKANSPTQTPTAEELKEKEEESHGKIFFTKNGKLAATRCIHNDEHFFEYPWFPAIGTDCYNIIEANFGNSGEPFVFDVVEFEQSKAWLKTNTVEINEPIIPDIRPNPCFQYTLHQIQQKWKDAHTSNTIYSNLLVPEKEYYGLYPYMKDYNYNWKETDKRRKAAQKLKDKQEGTTSLSMKAITSTIMESMNRLRASSLGNDPQTAQPEEEKQGEEIADEASEYSVNEGKR
jgi:hypothetical protein